LLQSVHESYQVWFFLVSESLLIPGYHAIYIFIWPAIWFYILLWAFMYLCYYFITHSFM